jgi:hypothetical protein
MAAMSRYFDRDGNAMPMTDWLTSFKPARGDDGQPDPSRHVGREEVNDPDGREHMVSTVWLGLEHGLGAPDPPLIFETMVFCHDHECEWADWQDRYSTEEEAAIGHAAVVGAVMKGEVIRD